MSDNRVNNGGSRKGAGRKPKADELKIIEQMDAVAVPKSVWKLLYDKATEGDTNAIKAWLQYRFGMPKQTIDQTTKLNINDFSIEDLYDSKT